MQCLTEGQIGIFRVLMRLCAELRGNDGRDFFEGS